MENTKKKTPHIHKCTVDECPATIPLDRLMCRKHWFMLPPVMQARIYRAWNRGQIAPNYMDVRAEAIAFVNGKEVKAKPVEQQPNLYQRRQAACRCLRASRRGFIKEKMDFANANDFPDGAFFAFMDENGIDVSEMEPFSTDHNCAGIAA